MTPRLMLLCIVGTLAAEPPAALATQAKSAEPQPSTFDTIWKFADWYENDDNSVIQRLQFSGRFQLDYAVVDADQGRHTEWNIRRFRLGAKAELFKSFTLHGEVTFKVILGEFLVLFTNMATRAAQTRANGKSTHCVTQFLG